MRVNEIFYSIQGEGFFSGTPAIFIRFSGCNLKCPFCDTTHHTYQELSEDEIIGFVSQYKSELVVITGGEPTLQLTDSLVERLHKIHKFVTIETNGTVSVPQDVDWITVSPKQEYVGQFAKPIISKANEVKVVYDNIHNVSDYGIEAEFYFVQPCDTGDDKKNEEIIKSCINFIKENPKWRLSLQTQKILRVR